MKKRNFHILTFGCQMNARDSQWLKACLEKRGFTESAPENADIIIINTCSVREKPEQKVRAAIQRLAAAMLENSFFCVTGCVAQQLGEEIFKFSPHVKLVAGTDGIGDLPDKISSLCENPNQIFNLTEFRKSYQERENDKQAGNSAFVTIMQGCDNFCSYCIVPFTKGRQKSRLKKDILAECGQRLDEGAVEITLLGQNVNAWGKDSQAGTFRELLDAIAHLPKLARLRFTTPHPADMTDDVVAAFSELPALCPRLHLPLQAGSDRILKLMRRRHTIRDFMLLVEKLKKANPKLALSTDIIVGFPGETDADFAQTMKAVEECNFVSSFSFCYSDRPGTRATLMPEKIPAQKAHERLIQLQALQDKLTRKWLEKKVGAETEILLEGKSAKGENFWQGRDSQGDIVNVKLEESCQNPFIKAKIIEAKAHTLLGEKIK